MLAAALVFLISGFGLYALLKPPSNSKAWSLKSNNLPILKISKIQNTQYSKAHYSYKDE